MKKILITGGTGFIGSHLAEFFVKKNFNVTVFDRYNPNNNWGNLESSKYKNDIKVILGDIRDYDSVKKSLKNIDTIFHLAALIGIPYSYISPLAYIKTNVEGTYNVLEAAKEKNIDQIIVTSTSETYGSAKTVPMNENHPLKAQSPYAASKISADQIALSYFNSFNQNIKIVRPFNTYGPRQSDRAVIPTIISQLLSKNKDLNLGNIKPTRDYTFVEDLCEAFFEISINKNLFGQVINVGSNEEISIENIAKLIMQKIKIKKKIIISPERKRILSSEVSRLICDNSRLIKYTNWKKRTSLDKGLVKTINWIKKNKKFFKIKNYNL
jgi:dTDP-glucose 4,6-dehydratase